MLNVYHLFIVPYTKLNTFYKSLFYKYIMNYTVLHRKLKTLLFFQAQQRRYYIYVSLLCYRTLCCFWRQLNFQSQCKP